MLSIQEETYISKDLFLLEYYKLFLYKLENRSQLVNGSQTGLSESGLSNNNLNNDIKLIQCNFTGDIINKLSDEKYIQYDDNHSYKWEMFNEYINHIYFVFVNQFIIEYEGFYRLYIEHMGKKIEIDFYKNFQ